MPIKIKSAGGGSITLDVPSTAVDTTLLLPTANGVTLFSNNSPVLTGNVAVSGANSYISINGDNVMPYTMKNRIINGDFNFWQRGTTFTVVNSVNTYSADRFRTEGFSANTTISQQSFAGGQTDVPDNPIYYCRVALNNTNTSGYWAFQQRIESPQVMRGFGTYTLSFWVRASSGTVAAGGWYYGINGPVAGPALTTTWQKVTQTVTISSSASESAGYVTAYLVYLAQNTAALSIDVAHVQVEAGPIATPFEFRPYGMELALCQRYYETNYDIGTSPGTVTGVFSGEYFNHNGVAGTYIAMPIKFAIRKRASPSVTLYSPSTGASGKCQTNRSGNPDATGGAASITTSGFSGGLTEGSGVACNLVSFNWIASIEL